MCYDDKARPPVPPGTPQQARGEDTVLTAADGNRFAAYIAYPAYPAHPESPNGTQVLIFPDVRGLHQFYKELALRFAEIGTTAVAIDYFGRTAGLTSRDDSFEYMPHVQQLTLPTVFADAKAALAHLRAGDNANKPVVTVGFCLGGSLSLLTGTQLFDLAGVVGFYAGMSRNFGDRTVLEAAKDMRYPVLGLFGGADKGIPVEQVQALDQTLDTAGVEHEIVIYPDAPHSFFDKRAATFANESADAWRRVLAFIAAHASPTHTS